MICLHPYSERQVKLHRIIKNLQEKRHLIYIAKLNALEIKTHRGKSFSISIHSILKRKKERDKWIERFVIKNPY